MWGHSLPYLWERKVFLDINTNGIGQTSTDRMHVLWLSDVTKKQTHGILKEYKNVHPRRWIGHPWRQEDLAGNPHWYNPGCSHQSNQRHSLSHPRGQFPEEMEEWWIILKISLQYIPLKYYLGLQLQNSILYITNLKTVTKEGEEHGEVDGSRSLIHHALQIIISWVLSWGRKEEFTLRWQIFCNTLINKELYII